MADRCTLCLYFWTFWLLLLTQVFFPAGAEVANNYQITIMLLFIFGVMLVCWRRERTKASDDVEMAALETEAGLMVQGRLSHGSRGQPASLTALGLDPEAPLQKVRLAWLDNLKIFLIVCVVLTHSSTMFQLSRTYQDFDDKEYNTTRSIMGIGFVGVENAPTFLLISGVLTMILKPVVMPLFFFVSGYFTPYSIDRKGPTKFVSQCIVRFGVPFIAFWLVLNPLTWLMCYGMVQPDASYEYETSSLHCWFLLWALVFQCGYATLSGPVEKLEIPSFGRLMCVSWQMSALQTLAAILTLLGGMVIFASATMLGPSGDGFLCLLQFVIGVAARRNDWLAQPLPNDLVSRSRIYMWLSWIVIVVLIIGLSVLASILGVDAGLLIILPAWLLAGALSPVTCVVFIHVFQQRLNFETCLSRFMADGVYTLYLSHVFFLNIFAHLLVSILRHGFDLQVDFVGGLVAEQALSEGTSWFGVLFCWCATLAAGFTMGGILKRVPVLGDYL